MNCPLCHADAVVTLYEIENIPIFQNKVYHNRETARASRVGDVSIRACENCSYAFNASFNPELMSYDDDYQNEQSHSPYFDGHLDKCLRILEDRGFRDKKTVEIGCGKGAFIKKLWHRGFDATGFDPAYEGDDPRIIKDYFSSAYSDVESSLIVLRHTLEHIPKPLDFLHEIAEATNGRGTIYIEVPSIEWIARKGAFWDFFYEHCNYFTKDTLASIFSEHEIGTVFDEQYIYVLGKLDSLQPRSTGSDNPIQFGRRFMDVLDHYTEFVSRRPGLIIWGAGAKGSTFANVTDPDCRYISRVIDINPKKQNQYIARSGHPIMPPESLDDLDTGEVLVMNDNYYDEIKSSLDDRFQLHVL
jgi:2-polyprenyl-3-methyl-5-hydroxy-6-metoxy-1,4-benzoquinol methylase